MTNKLNLMNSILLAGTVVFMNFFTLSKIQPLEAQSKSIKSKGVERQIGNGIINWTYGTIKVTGGGSLPQKGSTAQKRLMAERAAIADAYRQLAETVNGVQVFSETTVKNFVTESDVIRTSVNAVIKGARKIGKTRYLSDGGVEVDLEMPMYGKDSLAFALDFGEQIKKKSEEPYSYVGKPLALLQKKNDLTTDLLKTTLKKDFNFDWLLAFFNKIAFNTDVTGLIIDASGLGAEPAMGPFIIGAAKRVYPSNKIGMDSDKIVNQGITHYVEDINEAKKDINRVGNSPLIVQAKAVKGNPSTDILLTEEEINKIIEADKKSSFLKDLKVTIVI